MEEGNPKLQTAACLAGALLIVLFIAKNWFLRGLCIGFIIFLALIWILLEKNQFPYSSIHYTIHRCDEQFVFSL